MRTELGALEASAERAGTALACLYSSSEEFEAAQIDARRALWWRPQTVDGLLLVLTATTVAAVIALAALAGLALIEI